MKTLLAILLLIPSLSWGGSGDTYFCNITDLYRTDKNGDIFKYVPHTFKFQWRIKTEYDKEFETDITWNTLTLKDGPIFGNGWEMKGTSNHEESFSAYEEGIVLQYLFGKITFSWAAQINPTDRDRNYIEHTYMLADCTKF